jgi:hypothetical protein
VIVYSLPTDQAALGAQVPAVVGIVVLIIVTRLLIPRMRQAVEAVLPSSEVNPAG